MDQRAPSPFVNKFTQLLVGHELHHGQFTTVLHSSTEHLPHSSQVVHLLEVNAIQLALAHQNVLAGWHSEIEIASFDTISRSPYQKEYDAIVDMWIGTEEPVLPWNTNET